MSGVLQAQIDTVDTNTFATGLTFNSGNNNLILTRNDSVTITGNLQGVLVSGTTYHKSVSAASSSNNADRTYIQDILLDTHGHVTGLATGTETVTDTNTEYTAGTGLDLSGTEFNIDNTVLTTGSSLGDLSNVTLNAPVNQNQVIAYTSGTQNFVNTDLSLPYKKGLFHLVGIVIIKWVIISTLMKF